MLYYSNHAVTFSLTSRQVLVRGPNRVMQYWGWKALCPFFFSLLVPPSLKHGCLSTIVQP